MWEAILKISAFLFFQNLYAKGFVFVLVTKAVIREVSPKLKIFLQIMLWKICKQVINNYF